MSFKPGNYLLLFTDSKWGNDNNYYPAYYQFNVNTQNELSVAVAKAIRESSYNDGDDDDIFALLGSEPVIFLEGADGDRKIEDYEIIRVLETHSCLENWITGRPWHCGRVLLTKDNDHLWDALIKAGMPIN